MSYPTTLARVWAATGSAGLSLIPTNGGMCLLPKYEFQQVQSGSFGAGVEFDREASSNMSCH